MQINNINPYQGLQNAIRPGSLNASSGDNRPASFSSRPGTALMPEIETQEAQSLDIMKSVNALQGKWGLQQIQDPPFFPIATYQRMGLIDEVRSIQQDIESSTLRPELKQPTAGLKLRDDATDRQIANVLDKVLALRDTLSRELAVSKKDIQPGSILKLEV